MKRLTRHFCGLWTALAVAGACLSASAQEVPPLINFQGQLLDAVGNPMPTGDYEIQITLFPVESGGAAVWGPQTFNGQSGVGRGPKVSVVQGHFNLILGPKDTAERNLVDIVATNPSLFLEIKVGTGNPIAPRQQLLAAPYALQAVNATKFNGDQIVAKSAGIGATPQSGIQLEVNGVVLLTPGGSGGNIQFGSPNTETGMTIITNNRADFRFDGSTLKLLAGPGKLAPSSANGIAINTSGNVGIGTTAPVQKLHVIGNIVASGTITPNSDVNAKADFAPVDTAAILECVVKLPIQQWRFKTETTDVKHLGPMAQDFRAAFGLGEIPTAIATVDADGVALAAIQGLNRIVQEKDAEIQELKQSMAELKAQMKQLPGQRNASAR